MTELLPILAVLLGFLGSVLAVYATLRGQKTHTQESHLALAWDMQEKQLDMLTAENKDLRARLTNCDTEMIEMRRQFNDCKEGRRQLEIQVELLKLRMGER